MVGKGLTLYRPLTANVVWSPNLYIKVVIFLQWKYQYDGIQSELFHNDPANKHVLINAHLLEGVRQGPIGEGDAVRAE